MNFSARPTARLVLKTNLMTMKGAQKAESGGAAALKGSAVNISGVPSGSEDLIWCTRRRNQRNVCHNINQNSHMERPGIQPAPPWLETDEQQPKPRHSLHDRRVNLVWSTPFVDCVEM